MTTAARRAAFWERAGIWLLFIYLLMQVLDAPLRFFLVNSGAPSLIYTRDLLLVLMITPGLVRAGATYRVAVPFAIVMSGLAAFTLIGFATVSNAYQVLFGLKIFLPLLAGVLVGPAVFRNPGLFGRQMGFLCLLVVVGVFINVLVDYPWTGLQYQLEGYDIEGSFDRSTFELSRFTGFSRTNFEAASQALLFALPLLYLYRTRLAKVGLWLIIGGAIAITTTKGILVAYAVISVLILIVAMTGRRWVIKAAFISFLVATMVLPFVLTELNVDASDPVSVALFASFADRVNSGWPAVVLEMTETTGRLLVGKGMGGVGAAELYFSPSTAISPDNLFLFLFATFGIAVTLIFFWAGKQGLSVNENRPWPDRFILLTLLTIAIYGTSATVVESAVFSVFLGFALSYRKGSAANWAAAGEIHGGGSA